MSQKVVELLEEEASSLRAQGKRIAAEAVERVLARLRGSPGMAGKLGELRNEFLDINAGGSFRLVGLHLSQRRIGEDGISAEYAGHGGVEVLDPSDEDGRKALAKLSVSLPAPLKGFKRESVGLELPEFQAGGPRIINFKFRDVEVRREKA